MNKGYLYSCGGRLNHLREAIESARSVRRWDAKARICLVHGYSRAELEDGDTSVFDTVEAGRLDPELPAHIDGTMRHFLAKIQGLIQSPFEATLFLDADTRILGPVENLFALMERFDIAVAAGPVTQKAVDETDVLHQVPDSFPEANSGVILWRRNARMMDLLKRWLVAYRDNEQGLFRRHRKGGEQVSLRYLLWASPEVRLHFLASSEMPNLCNFRFHEEKSFVFKKQIRILHHRAAIAARERAPTDRTGPERPTLGHGASNGRRAAMSYREAAAIFDAYCESKSQDFFFIQIGANDGKTHDPIWQRIKKHRWQGIMVEPVKYLYDRLLRFHGNRAGLIFENIAIAAYDGTTPFHHFPEVLERDPNFPGWAKGMGSILGRFESPGHQLVAERGFNMVAAEVPCLTLESLCKRYDVRSVDLLQIDAEGCDGDILCSTDFSRIRPRFIQYEDRHTERVFAQGRSRWSPADVTAHLEAAGYQVFSVGNGFDRFCLQTEPLKTAEVPNGSARQQHTPPPRSPK